MGNEEDRLTWQLEMQREQDKAEIDAHIRRLVLEGNLNRIEREGKQKALNNTSIGLVVIAFVVFILGSAVLTLAV